MVQDEDDSEDKESDSEEEQASSTAVSQSTKPAHSAEIKHKASLNTPRPKRQPSMDRYINMTPSNSNVKDTPVQPKRGNPPENSWVKYFVSKNTISQVANAVLTLMC